MTSIISIVAIYAGLLVTLGTVAFVWLRQDYLARRKGYTPIAAGTVVAGVLVGAIIFGLLTTMLVDDRDWSKATKKAFVLLSVGVASSLAGC